MKNAEARLTAGPGHVVLSVPSWTDPDVLAERARHLGFAAQPLERYRHRPDPPGVVLGYGAVSERTIGAGAAGLLDALTGADRGRPRAR